MCVKSRDHEEGQSAGEGSPAAGRGPAALALHGGWSLRAQQGLLPPLRAARAGCSLHALAVSAWHIASCSRVLFKVQRLFFLQCVNKRHFYGRESWFKSNSDGGEKWAKLQVSLSEALAVPGVQSLCPA